jgi:hypothetical protein
MHLEVMNPSPKNLDAIQLLTGESRTFFIRKIDVILFPQAVYCQLSRSPLEITAKTWTLGVKYSINGEGIE